NRVHQSISLMETTAGNQGSMVKLPGSELMADVGAVIEVAISVPIGYGGHAACLPWMDDALIPSEPEYASIGWIGGLTSLYGSWAMWALSPVYPIPRGQHISDIRCHNDSGSLQIGEENAASVLIVRELDHVDQDFAQGLDEHGNGSEING